MPSNNLKSSYKNNATCHSGAFGTLVTNWCSPFQASNAITVPLGVQFNLELTYWMQRESQTVKAWSPLRGEVSFSSEHTGRWPTDMRPDSYCWFVAEMKYTNLKPYNTMFKSVWCIWKKLTTELILGPYLKKNSGLICQYLTLRKIK